MLDPVLLVTLSDLLLNLSAGWFGATLIVIPGLKEAKLNRFLLTINIGSGSLTLLVAYLLRKLI